MAGVYPNSPEFRSIEFKSYHRVMRDTSHSGRGFRRRLGGSRWSFILVYNSSLTRDDCEEIYSFIQKQSNGFETFTITLPDKSVPRGTATGSPSVNGAGQTGSSISVQGFTPNITNIMRKGDIFKFNGHTKVYMVVDDANSNGSGQTTLNFSPPLIVSPASDEVIIVNNVPFTVIFDDEMSSYTGDPGLFYGLTIPLIEEY